MFTVKSRAADGTETIYSCETVTVIGGPSWLPNVAVAQPGTPLPKRDMYQEGIFLDREMQPRAPDEPPFFTSKHIILFGGDETIDRVERKGGKVWVMNEQGSTVATYDL